MTDRQLVLCILAVFPVSSAIVALVLWTLGPIVLLGMAVFAVLVVAAVARAMGVEP